MERILKTAMIIAAASVLSACSIQKKYFSNLPDGMDPVTVGNRIAAQFLSVEPESYAPKGFDGTYVYGHGREVSYPQTSLWVNSMEFARNSSNTELEKKLIDRFEPFFGSKKKKCSRNNHVDHSVFGAIPLEVYILNGDKRAFEMGIAYADHQWAEPDSTKLGGNGNFDYATQMQYLADGYTPQTRLWIDDMYMINFLQTQAYRATGDIRYIERCAKEMVLYLDTIQLENGLFYHSADVPFVWGRGDGWMAAAMPMLLKYLPKSNGYYTRIMEGYLKMMTTLLSLQHESGMWGQLVDDPEAWDESSCTGMFCYAFIEGVKQGFLDAGTFAPAARKAWIALCSKLDSYGNVSDVCVGTNRFNSRQYYLDRPRFNGDPHGQAAMMWVANALVTNKSK